MLHQWVAPDTVEAFVRTHLRIQPYARPGAAWPAVSLFGWDTLGRVLAREPAPDVLTITRGRVVPVPVPRTVQETQRLLRRGIGLVIRRAERQDARLAALAASFAQELPGDVHLQLFVTAAGTHSFGWHYDCEEVFIVQTLGVKDYFLRDNTVERQTPSGAPPDFTKVRAEVSPLAMVRLLAGDWLYIPARWWHVAKCVEEALSISVGVGPSEQQRADPAVP